MNVETAFIIIGVAGGYWMLAKVVDRLAEIRNPLEAARRREESAVDDRRS